MKRLSLICLLLAIGIYAAGEANFAIPGVPPYSYGRLVVMLLVAAVGLRVLSALVGIVSWMFLPARAGNRRPAPSDMPPGYGVKRDPDFGAAAVMAPRYCGRCRNELADEARFCPRCGVSVTPPAAAAPARIVTALPPPPVQQVIAPRRSSSRFGWIFFIVCLVFLFKLGMLRQASHWVQSLAQGPSSAIQYDSGPELPPTQDSVASGVFEKVWVETNAMDSTGNVGYRVHALLGGDALKDRTATGSSVVAQFRYAGNPDIAAQAVTLASDYSGDARSGQAAFVGFMPYLPLISAEVGTGLSVRMALLDEMSREISAANSVALNDDMTLPRITRIRSTEYASFSPTSHRSLLVSFGIPVRPVPTYLQVEAKFKTGGLSEADVQSREVYVPARPASSVAGSVTMMNDFPLDIPVGRVSAGATAQVYLKQAAKGLPLSTPVTFNLR